MSENSYCAGCLHNAQMRRSSPTLRQQLPTLRQQLPTLRPQMPTLRPQMPTQSPQMRIQVRTALFVCQRDNIELTAAFAENEYVHPLIRYMIQRFLPPTERNKTEEPTVTWRIETVNKYDDNLASSQASNHDDRSHGWDPDFYPQSFYDAVVLVECNYKHFRVGEFWSGKENIHGTVKILKGLWGVLNETGAMYVSPELVGEESLRQFAKECQRSVVRLDTGTLFGDVAVIQKRENSEGENFAQMHDVVPRVSNDVHGVIREFI